MNMNKSAPSTTPTPTTTQRTSRFVPYKHPTRDQRRQAAISARQASDNIHLLASTNDHVLLESVLTSLLVATTNSNPERVLLSVDSKRRTMLHFACAQGSVETVRVLLNFRRRFFTETKNHPSRQETRILRHEDDDDDDVDDDDSDDDDGRILTANRMLSMRDVNGSSPLHLAVVGNHLTIVSLLLQAGADLSGCDGSGRTPLDLVRSRTRVLTAKYNNNNNSNGFLNTAGSSPPDAFHGPKLLSELNEMMDILSIYHTRSRNAPPLYNPSAEYQAGEMSMDTLNAKFQKLSSADNSRLSSSETNVEEIVDEIGSLFATLKLQQQ